MDVSRGRGPTARGKWREVELWGVVGIEDGLVPGSVHPSGPKMLDISSFKVSICRILLDGNGSVTEQ